MVIGASRFGKGVASGLKGVVEQPFVGAKDNGTKGFFKGVATGATGFVVKPLSGAADAISALSQSFGETFNVTDSVFNIF